MVNSDSDRSSHILLELSSKVEYALLALIELASHPTKKAPLNISEIVTKQPIPERYLEQVLTSLRRSGLVQSHRGSRGGYVLTREPWEITLLEVVTALEGDRKEKKRSESTTPERDVIYKIWQQVNLTSQGVLRSYTLQDLCQQRDDRQQKNPMYYI
jgi:Rrf2 family protein